MVISFYDQGTADVYNRRDAKAARSTCPRNLWPTAQRKLDQMNAAVELSDLASPPGNHLEQLQADREGQHSIRINSQYRIYFVWTPPGPERVEITDYH